jgi:hypothetical protein
MRKAQRDALTKAALANNIHRLFSGTGMVFSDSLGLLSLIHLSQSSPWGNLTLSQCVSLLPPATRSRPLFIMFTIVFHFSSLAHVCYCIKFVSCISEDRDYICLVNCWHTVVYSTKAWEVKLEPRLYSFQALLFLFRSGCRWRNSSKI